MNDSYVYHRKKKEEGNNNKWVEKKMSNLSGCHAVRLNDDLRHKCAYWILYAYNIHAFTVNCVLKFPCARFSLFIFCSIHSFKKKKRCTLLHWVSSGLDASKIIATLENGHQVLDIFFPMIYDNVSIDSLFFFSFNGSIIFHIYDPVIYTSINIINDKTASFFFFVLFKKRRAVHSTINSKITISIVINYSKRTFMNLNHLMIYSLRPLVLIFLTHLSFWIEFHFSWLFR